MKWDEHKDELTALIKAGASRREAADHFGVSTAAVGSAMMRFGLVSSAGWTDDVIAFMRPLLEQGATGQQVAEAVNRQFGTSFRSAAIIQKALQEGISCTQSAAEHPRRDERHDAAIPTNALRRIEAGPGKEVDLDRAPGAGPGVGLMDLEWNHCRAVIDNRGADGFAVFCGEPVKLKQGLRGIEHLSWCPFHCGQFLTPPPPLKERGEARRPRAYAMEAAE